MLLSSVLIDTFALIPFQTPDVLVSTLYGGVLCGVGVGMVFGAGTSTGGAAISWAVLRLPVSLLPQRR